MNDDTEQNVQQDSAESPRFTKKQLLQSAHYADKHDLLTALLEDDKQYSHSDVAKLLNNFLKGRVN